MLEQSTVSDDQPSLESTQQEQDQVNEQPEKTGEDVQEESQKTDSEAKTEGEIEIDGEKLTPDQIKEWKAGYLRQQDYTKKTQELAEEKRKLSRTESVDQQVDRKAEELDPELKTALDTLKKAGVVTKEDLALMKAQEEDQKQFKKLFKRYPDLKTHEKAIAQIGKVDNKAWEDIAVEYGFLNKDKLEKAKESRPIIGQKSVTPAKTKSFLDMTEQEFAEWKTQNLSDGLKSIN